MRATATGQSNNTDILAKMDNATQVAPWKISQASGTYDVELFMANTTQWDMVNGATIGTLSNGVWAHLVVVRRGTNMYCYFDGVHSSTTAVSTTAVYSASTPVLIGGGNFSNTYFTGNIDEVRISDYDRTADPNDPLFIASGDPTDGFDVPTQAYDKVVALSWATDDQALNVSQNLEVEGQAWSNTATLTDAATIATDCDDGNVFEVTLTDNRTLGAPSNLKDGATYIWIIKQDAGGGNTLSYNSVFKFPGGTAPTLSTGSNAIDVLTGVSDGTNIYCTMQNNFS